jgi:hypothetical protein
MFKVRNFALDTRGDMLKSVAITASAVAVGSLALTHLLDRATQSGSLPHIAIIATPGQDLSQRVANLPRPTASSAVASAGQYDTTPVGSIGGRAMPQIVLDPCSGQQR